MVESRYFVLHANLVSGVGPVFFQRLDQKVHGDFSLCYGWQAKDFVAQVGCTVALANRLVEGLADRRLLEKELASIEQANASWCTLFEQEYPELLRSIYAPPPVLLWRGSYDALVADRSVAFVGARTASGYARQVARTCIAPLARSGIVVVSGGARGADTFAHEAALEAGGVTVAVVGSGLLHPYPRNNSVLFDRIISSGGAVVSPFPMNMRAVPGNFPARNRIIAGLASMTVVLQAAQKSGALITAYFALEQGREVGAVPGSVFDELSSGAHRLLAQGAVPVTSADDIVQACGWCAGLPEAASASLSRQTFSAEAEVDPLVSACKEPQSLDDLALQFDCIDRSALQERLLDLCLQGVLFQDFTGQFCVQG